MRTGQIICLTLCSIILLGGLSLIGVGTAAQILYGDICQRQLKLSVGYISIILGSIVVLLMVIIMIFSSLKSPGSCGVIFLGISFILVLTSGGLLVYLWLNKGNFSTDAKLCINEYFTRYEASEVSESTINMIQKKIKCCGKTGPDSFSSSALPSSCCRPEVRSCTKTSDGLVRSGCSTKFKNLFQFYFPITFGILTAVCSIIIILILFSCYYLVQKSDEYFDY